MRFRAVNRRPLRRLQLAVVCTATDAKAQAVSRAKG